MIHINQGIASYKAKSCNCSFDIGNIVNESVLLQCRDSISAELSMEIKPVEEHSVHQLICQFYILLNWSKNVIDLGKLIFATLVVLCSTFVVLHQQYESKFNLLSYFGWLHLS